MPSAIDPSKQILLVFFGSDDVAIRAFAQSLEKSRLSPADREQLPMANFAGKTCRPDSLVGHFGKLLNADFWTELFAFLASDGTRILDVSPNAGPKLVAAMRLNLHYHSIEDSVKLVQSVRPALAEHIARLYEATELQAYLDLVKPAPLSSTRPVKISPKEASRNSDSDSDSGSDSASEDSKMKKKAKQLKMMEKLLKQGGFKRKFAELHKELESATKPNKSMKRKEGTSPSSTKPKDSDTTSTGFSSQPFI